MTGRATIRLIELGGSPLKQPTTLAPGGLSSFAACYTPTSAAAPGWSRSVCRPPTTGTTGTPTNPTNRQLPQGLPGQRQRHHSDGLIADVAAYSTGTGLSGSFLTEHVHSGRVSVTP